jgi:hypothetical protein
MLRPQANTFPITTQNEGKVELGAIEGTRTPTPLRVHGPEPCASANSATMAIVTWLRSDPCEPPFRREPQYSTGAPPAVKLECPASALKIHIRESEVRAPALPKSRSANSVREPAASPQPLSFQLGSHRNIRFEHL